MSESDNYKDHLILMVDSGTFKAHLVTAKELKDHATEEMGEPDADEFDVVGDYVEGNLNDYATCGWTELDLSDDKAKLKLLDNIAELKTLLTRVKQ